MATITFAARIAQDLRILVASAAVIDGTNQRGTGTTEVTAISDRIAVMVAAKLESDNLLGDVGDFDDAATSIAGDLSALDIGVRLAQVRMNNVYPGLLSEQGMMYEKDIIAEAQELATARRQLASTPVVVETAESDGTDIEVDED
jgi:hypothetical protein